MARFAVVAPCNIVETLRQRKLMGNTHLLLAHDVVNKPERYHDLFAHSLEPEGIVIGPRLVILDTSVIELGEAVDIDMMIEAIAITKPNVVVLPDVLYNKDTTIRVVEDAINLYDRAGIFKFGIELMLCPQGANFREYIECAEYFNDSSVIKWWGVPRDALNTMPSRRKLTETLYCMDTSKRIHLLGFSDDHVDDMLCANLSYVTSIDSAVPLRLQNPISLIEETPKRDPEWWENAEWTHNIPQNLKTVRRWFNDLAHGLHTLQR